MKESDIAMRASIARMRIDENPTLVANYLEATLVFGEADDREAVYDYLESVLELDTRPTQAYLTLIEQALALGRRGEARAYYAQGLELANDPAPIVKQFDAQFDRRDVLRIPIPETRPYLLACPVWDAPSAGLRALLGAYTSTFTPQDGAFLVLPAPADTVNQVYQLVLGILKEIGAPSDALPEIAIQPFVADFALRSLIYRARAFYDGDDMDLTAADMAGRLACPRIAVLDSATLKGLFMPKEDQQGGEPQSAQPSQVSLEPPPVPAPPSRWPGARNERRKRSRISKASAYLSDFQSNVTSQYGEDGITAAIFQRIGEGTRWCVEFGAGDGRSLSNTWSLINQHGWSGVLLEGDRDRFAALSSAYAGRDSVFPLNSIVDWGEHALDKVLQRTPIPRTFDFLSIDIDGCDYYVWEALVEYRPRVVVIEFNPSIPNHILFVQKKDLFINQGSSLLAMIELGKKKGYELAATTGTNGFFVVQEEYARLNIPDNDIDLMFDAEESGSLMDIFQLYDGTLVLSGCDRLAWHEIPIGLEDIQILPPEKRVFPASAPFRW